MMYLKGVSWFKKASMASPVVVNAIPVEATDRGSILSESLPATGERIAILMTWVYSNTKGSMLLIVLFYASAVASAVIFTQTNISAEEQLLHVLIQAAPCWLIAMIVVATAGAERLVREPKK